jgi:hypothetical protein
MTSEPTSKQRNAARKLAAVEGVGTATVVAPEIEATSWEPVDLTDALAGADIPPPTILARTDGLRLLYPGRTHAFIGESESCKTWAALLAAREVMETGQMVLWIDFEDEPRGTVSRLRSLGVPVETIASRLHYLHPEEALVDRQGRATVGNAALGRLLETYSYGLAVIDGVTEGMTVEGLDPLGTDAAAIWSRRLAKRIAVTGPAVVALDHVPKSSDNRGRYAIGSQHKIAGLTGASYVFEVGKPLARATTAPVEGSVTVKVTKDRPGYVRGFTTSSETMPTVAVLELTAHPDGGVTGRLVPPSQASGTPPADLLLKIFDHLRTYPGSSASALEKTVGGKNETVRAVVSWLAHEDRGYVMVERTGRSHLHTMTDAGRAFFESLDT